MKFFRDIKDSIYNPDFYKSIPLSKLETHLSYFFKLILLLSFVEVLLLSFPVYIGITELTNKALPALVQRFPANLSVSIKDGKASTNVRKPYFVMAPQDNSANAKKNLIVIDTKDPYTSKEFSKFDTASLLTSDTLFVDSQQGIRSFSLENVKNITIDRQHLTQYLNKFSPLVKFITPLILLLMFLALFIFYSLRLIYLVFLAVIIMLVSRIIKPDLDFSNSYKVGLRAMTLGILVEAGLTILSPVLHLHGFEFMVTIISVLIYILNFKQEPKTISSSKVNAVKLKRSTSKSKSTK